ncbi:arylamine N-acetyltransferase-like [Dermacentor variabilis]|uniref:arylamine N-acetyltransferase-like n=1 Tax=Dermacentor variabilis TaxID=34621 RepID=UPI003F5C6A27
MGPLNPKERLLCPDVLKLQQSALREQNLATLKILTEAYVERIPSQNIDVFVRNQLSLNDDSVFCKVNEQHRSGSCIELNNLFGRLLLTLRFRFHIRAARVHWKRPMDSTLTPLGHVLLCVDMGEEGEYLAEVAYEGPTLSKRFL